MSWSEQSDTTSTWCRLPTALNETRDESAAAREASLGLAADVHRAPLGEGLGIQATGGLPVRRPHRGGYSLSNGSRSLARLTTGSVTGGFGAWPSLLPNDLAARRTGGRGRGGGRWRNGRGGPRRRRCRRRRFYRGDSTPLLVSFPKRTPSHALTLAPAANGPHAHPGSGSPYFLARVQPRCRQRRAPIPALRRAPSLPAT
jgi:hypothetical protein